MTAFLSVEQVCILHAYWLESHGGTDGLRDRGMLESAVAQPQHSFDGIDLYPTIESKAAALGYSIIKNHAFVDGNKRVGISAVELFIEMNDRTCTWTNDQAIEITQQIAAGVIGKDEFIVWISDNTEPLGQS